MAAQRITLDIYSTTKSPYNIWEGIITAQTYTALVWFSCKSLLEAPVNIALSDGLKRLSKQKNGGILTCHIMISNYDKWNKSSDFHI